MSKYNEHYLKAKVTQSFSFTPLDVCSEYDFITGNIIKYILRYRFKNQAVTDLTKALDYLCYKVEVKSKQITVDNMYFFIAILTYKQENILFDTLVNDDGSITLDNINKTKELIQNALKEFNNAGK